MEAILPHLECINLVNNGINYLSTGAGFQPSTVVTWKHEFNADIKINLQASRPWTIRKSYSRESKYGCNGSCQFARPCSNHVYIYIDIIRSTSISTLASPFTMHTAGTSMVWEVLLAWSQPPILPYHPVPARSLSNSPSGAYFGNPSNSPLRTTYKQVIKRRDALINLNTKQKCTPKLVLLRLF